MPFVMYLRCYSASYPKKILLMCMLINSNRFYIIITFIKNKIAKGVGIIYKAKDLYMYVYIIYACMCVCVDVCIYLYEFTCMCIIYYYISFKKYSFFIVINMFLYYLMFT